jgi:hypothetical protein
MGIESRADYYLIYREICWEEGIQPVPRRQWDLWQAMLTGGHSIIPEEPDWVIQFCVVAAPLLRLGAHRAPSAFSGQGEG